MGLSYNITPTSELTDKKAYLDHFKKIETYEFPNEFNIDTNSKFPNLQELSKAILESGCMIMDKSEEHRQGTEVSTSYQLKHPEYKCESDFTFHHDKAKISSIIGIHADFRIMLRIATKLTETCGTMIIWSAYDAHYVEKGKTFDQIWNKLKANWDFEE